MGNCKYCDEPAGLLRSTHPECQAFVDDTARYIAELILHLFKTGEDPQPIFQSLTARSNDPTWGHEHSKMQCWMDFAELLMPR